MGLRARHWFYGIIIVSVILAFLYFALTTISVTTLKDYVKSFGFLEPLILFIMIFLTSSVGFIFQMPVTVTAILLPFWAALIISVLGLTFGAAISFLLARRLGREYVEKKYVNNIKRLKEYDAHLKRKGFLTVLILRLITIIPFELINIAGGLSRIKFLDFIIATIIGIIPGTLMAIFFARTLTEWYSLQFLFALALNLSFSLIPLLFIRVRKIVFGKHSK